MRISLFDRGPVRWSARLVFALALGSSGVSAQTAAAPSDVAKRLLDTARQLNGLAIPAIQPWHIKVSFQRYSRSGNFVDQGKYEFLWDGSAKTKAIYESPSFSQVQYSSHEGTFVTGDHGDPPGLLALIWWIAYSPLPSERTVAHLGASLHKAAVSGDDLDCVEMGKGPAITRYDRETDTLIDPASDASTPRDSYCFDEHRFLARSSRTINNFGEKIHALFRDPLEFDHRMVARDLDLDLGGILGLTAHVESIEPLQDSSETEFQVPPEAREHGNEEFRFSDLPKSNPSPSLVSVLPGVAARQLVRRTSVIYPQEAKAAGIEGTVVLKGRISKSGTIESLQIVSGPEPLRQAALDAVNSWVYRPYVLNGSAVEVETTINVGFKLERPQDQY